MTENLIKMAVGLGLAVAVIGCLVSWIAAVSVVITGPRKRKPGVSWLKAVEVNSMLFRPHLYTDGATPEAKRFIYGLVGFMFFWCVGVVCGWLTRN